MVADWRSDVHNTLHENASAAFLPFYVYAPIPLDQDIFIFIFTKRLRHFILFCLLSSLFTMDRQSVFSLSVLPPEDGDNENSRNQTQTQLEQFILQFRLDNAFIYRDQIRENVLLRQYYCDVDVGHLISFNEELAHRLVTEPTEIVPLVDIPP